MNNSGQEKRPTVSRKRSKKGFWGFLRAKKARLPESEASDAGALAGEQDACQTPKEDSFDALFAYLDEEQCDADLESKIVPPEALEQTKDQAPPPSAWEISEEKEMQESEFPERKSLGEAEPPELGECTSVPGMVLEKLRVLEEQVVSLESCIAERLNSHR
jgi:hypothetical protein